MKKKQITYTTRKKKSSEWGNLNPERQTCLVYTPTGFIKQLMETNVDTHSQTLG